MVSKAKGWVRENGFDFIITGEVIRSKINVTTQNNYACSPKQSVIDNLLLRPLSAQNLPETKPEREG